jgi:hypothetical protein
MKKMALCILMLLLIVGTAGCRKEEKFITADEVTVNTILAKSNGVLQVATVEDFNKSYYDLNELKKFIAGEIDAYNKKAGGDKITINDVKLRGGKAIMLLTYTGMDQYAAFNGVSAAYFNGGVENVGMDLPETLVNAKDGSLVSIQGILKDAKYKILIMNEPYNIIVDGKVKYYSDTAKMIDNKTIQGAAEGMTIVVFKP